MSEYVFLFVSVFVSQHLTGDHFLLLSSSSIYFMAIYDGYYT